jgi:CubicO group peptidase (beta-lactamase class C family)
MMGLLLVGSSISAAADAQNTSRMARIVEAQAADNHFMGTVLVAKDGVPFFEKSHGFANVEWQVPNTPTTKFRIGSVTKQYTAAAVLLLEERGLLTLKDPVSKHVPDAPAAWEKVTVHHLLTHTSGIPSFTSFPEYGTWKLAATSAAKTVAHFRDRPLEFEPGERHVYSNSGYLLLGHIIERVSGQTYETFVKDNLLTPLGITDSGYDWNATILPQRASGYVRTPSGLANAPYVDMHVPHGAGALYSTAHDMLRWTQGLLGGGLLSPASLEKMTTPYKNDYALGLVVRTANGRKVIEHGGAIDGFNAHLSHFPDEKLTVVVLSNVSGPAADTLARQLAQVAFGEQVVLISERQEIEVPASTLKDYVGVYQLTPRLTTSIRLVDGRLTAQPSGQVPHPLFPESETKFFLKVVDAQMEFFRDTGGRVTHLVHHQNGRTHKAERISDVVAERKAISVPPSMLATFVGEYQLAPGFAITVTLEGDQLMTQATGQPRFPIFAEAETKFFLKVVDAQLEFVRDASGAVTHAILHQGGRSREAPRAGL